MASFSAVAKEESLSASSIVFDIPQDLGVVEEVDVTVTERFGLRSGAGGRNRSGRLGIDGLPRSCYRSRMVLIPLIKT